MIDRMARNGSAPTGRKGSPWVSMQEEQSRCGDCNQESAKFAGLRSN